MNEPASRSCPVSGSASLPSTAWPGTLATQSAARSNFYLPKPVWSPDEQFHRAITESLAEWWRQQGGQFAAVTVIGTEPSARVHEIRDLLTRNSVPFGFQRADSEEGSAALQRLGLSPSSGPVVTLHTGVVLADPANSPASTSAASSASRRRSFLSMRASDHL
jgi:hypothetical protein